MGSARAAILAADRTDLDDGAAAGEERESFLYGEEQAFDVGVEGFVVVRFGDGA